MQSRASLFAAVLTGLAVLGLSTWSQAVQAETRQPVVVELYTSQGCSSCPPADAFLGELARQDDVIALSLHVDYWDYMGWTDTFASPVTTARQRAYKQALNSRYVYTPQIVVDGRGHAVGSRRAEVRTLIAEAQARPKPLAPVFDPAEGGRVVIPAGAAPPEGATIWLAVYDGAHETAVERGENRGKTLRYSHVVRELVELGTWTGEALVLPLDLAAAEAAGRAGCAVIVQEGRNGPVLGAIKMDLMAGQ